MKQILARVTGGQHYKWWVLVTVGVGVFMSTIDFGMVNISLPTIMGHFGASLAVTEWIVLSYALLLAAIMLPSGRLADMFGRKRIYSLGFGFFTGGAILSSLSQSAEQLIAFRGVQAVGGAMLMANGMAIVASVFPPQERGQALGINGTVVAIGITIGPTLGGSLIHAFGWRSIFFVSIPLGIIGSFMANAVLREDLISPPRDKNRHFDIVGAVMAAVALGSLLLGLSSGQEGNWDSTWVRVELAIAGMAFVAFPFWEARARYPMLDLKLFANRLYSAGSAAGLLSFLGITANALLMPFFLQLGLGYTPLKAGLLMTSTSLAMAIMAPISGRLSDRFGARLLSSVGLALNAIALLWLSTVSPDTSNAEVLKRLVLLGIGQGLFQPPNNSSVMGAVPRESYGIASSLMAMTRAVGSSLGIALAGTLLASGMVAVAGHASVESLRAGIPGVDRQVILSGFMLGLRRAYLVAGLICAIGIPVSLVRGQTPRCIGAGDSVSMAETTVKPKN